MSERRSGYRTSVPGLIGAMLAVLALIVFVWGLTRFQHRDVDDPAETVDYTSELSDARAQAPFDVLAPDPAPQGWRATSVKWSGAGPEVSWHLGFLTGTGDSAGYVGLEQGNAQPGPFVAESTTADQPGPPVTIAGAEWQQLTQGDETALVLFGDGVTTVVTGTVPLDELITFAASLSP